MKKITKFFLLPLQSYLASFVILAFLLFLPELFISGLSRSIGYFFKHLLSSVAFSVAVSYIIVWVVFAFSKIHSILANIILVVAHIAIYCLSFSSIFLYRFFGAQINSYVLHLVEETTAEESQGFASTYFTDPRFLILIGLFLMAGIAEFVIHCYYSKKGNRLTAICQKWFIKMSAIAYIIYSLGYLLYFSPIFSTDYLQNELTVNVHHPMSFNILFRTSQAYWQFIDERKDISRCANANGNLSVDTCSYRSPNIVIVIGESFNRHHSSLYGYSLETNPRLSADSSLYIFSDVISPANGTTRCFEYFMSLSSVEDTIRWNDVPLVPGLFKAAGYNVVFYSNQFTKQVSQSAFDASSGFFFHPTIEHNLFSHSNTRKRSYDLELLNQYVSERNEIEKETNNLIFFHLMGQHVRASSRYPSSETYFTADSINRTDLNEKQKEEVAQYDNATRYNDKVVNSIFEMFDDKDAIVIYFADHGDEVNDFRPKIGRSFDFGKAGEPCFHCQLDIPFLIHVSKQYRTNHPEIIKSIENAVDLPFMIDDLPHLLLDLAGIKTSWYQPNRSLINSQFDSTRKRLEGWYNYDYDEICTSKSFLFGLQQN